MDIKDIKKLRIKSYKIKLQTSLKPATDENYLLSKSCSCLLAQPIVYCVRVDYAEFMPHATFLAFQACLI